MTPRRRADRRAGLLFLTPALLALALLTVYPIVWVLWLSLERRIPVFGVARFVGFSNYEFLAWDPRLWNAARRTLDFTRASGTLEPLLGVLVSLVLSEQRR